MGSKWTAAQIPDLTGQIIVVTGGNSGLGWETALELGKHGAQVVIACRNPEKAQDAVARIQAAHAGATVEAMALDLASLASVYSFAQHFTQRFAKLDVLVNNAGVMALPHRATVDGFEMQLGTNHLGHFALTGLLLESLFDAPHPRVVTVSSFLHRHGRIDLDDLQGEKKYKKWGAYSQSKLANLLFMAEFEHRLEAAKLPILSVAAHPGFSSTNLQAAGPRMEGSTMGEWFSKVNNALFAQSAAMGALPSLYAATAPDVKGGEYFGPGGLLEMAGYPRRAKRAAAARDEAVAKALWERSVELTKVDYAQLKARH
jgi:NAD(P)-dependent dehydrogenase (short-subunit alcohol dehydrogenase family)